MEGSPSSKGTGLCGVRGAAREAWLVNRHKPRRPPSQPPSAARAGDPELTVDRRCGGLLRGQQVTGSGFVAVAFRLLWRVRVAAVGLMDGWRWRGRFGLVFVVAGVIT